MKHIFLLLLGVFSMLNMNQSRAAPLMIEDFEIGEIPVVRPTRSDYSRYLWGHVPKDNADNQRPGNASLSNEASYQSKKALKITLEGPGNLFLHFYPYDEDNFEWRYVREQLQSNNRISGGEWKFDYYNRLRFWIKASEFQIPKEPKKTNFHFGTYIRSTTFDRNDAESSGGGGHFYHYYQIPPTGSWHQIIVDFHPSHERGASGNTEHGVKEHPTSEPGYNYFDLLTRFYFDFKSELTEYPDYHFIDQIELYHEPNIENIEQVYSLNGVFVDSNNMFIVGWKRLKNEDNIAHEIRYSLTDIHVSGWSNATSLPGNQVIPTGVGGYNGMEYSTSSIDTNGVSEVYFAIKPSNSNLFRQITIPIISSKPHPPSNLSVTVN